MSKRKYPSELNTRTVRVNIGDWQMLLALARQHDTTVAKVLHLAITQQARQEQIAVPRSQIPMPTFTVKAPVALRVRPQPILTTNGHKAGVFVTKPKGGIIQ